MFSIQCNKDLASQQKYSDTLNVCFPEVFFLAYIFALNTNASQVHSIWHMRIIATECVMKEM